MNYERLARDKEKIRKVVGGKRRKVVLYFTTPQQVLKHTIIGIRYQVGSCCRAEVFTPCRNLGIDRALNSSFPYEVSHGSHCD